MRLRLEVFLFFSRLRDATKRESDAHAGGVLGK
jgi:hypothetical protein